jgi:hypothetical protein
MATPLYRSARGIVGFGLNVMLRNPFAKYLIGDLYTADQSAEVLVKLAVVKKWEGEEYTGKYYHVKARGKYPSSKASHDKGLQKDLWDWTIREIAEGNEAEQWDRL